LHTHEKEWKHVCNSYRPARSVFSGSNTKIEQFAFVADHQMRFEATEPMTETAAEKTNHK
jgi:hypothetical protein